MGRSRLIANSRAACRTTGKTYKITNWCEFVRRGEVTLWLEEDVIVVWEHENAEPKVDRPFTYNDGAIRCLLSLREVFGLTYQPGRFRHIGLSAATASS